MPQIMGELSQMLNLYKEYPDILALTESMTWTYRYEFMKAMTQDIKELEQHGTWAIVSRKSVTGTHILPNTWDFKVKRFPDGRLW